MNAVTGKNNGWNLAGFHPLFVYTLKYYAQISCMNLE